MADSPRKSTKKAPSARKPALAGYLQKILTARVYDVAIESALDPAPRLSARLGNRVLFKREDTQPVFSFKLRGAYNKMAHLSAEALARGVICASAGNHAQGVALAAHELGCKALVVMPTTTPSLKIGAVRALGAEVVLRGDSYSDAYAHALELEAKRGLTFVHPFDDPDVIAGQGTIAMEILRQHQGPIDAIFVAIGGGGLVSGIAAYVKAVRPGDPHRRRADERLRRDAALGARRPAGRARRRRTLLRRHRGEEGRRRDLPPGAPAGRRLDRRRQRRRLRRDQGRVRGHPQHPRAGRRARRRRDQAVRAGTRRQGRDLRRDHLRREHELRPPALRRRAGRGRRGARSPVRGDHSRGARQLQAPVRADRPARGDRVQLPHLGRAPRPMSSSASRRSTGPSRRSSRSTSPATAFPPST